MENENILTFFSVIFLTGFFLILPVYATSSFKLATPDEFGPNELISGTLLMPLGTYLQNDKVKLSIGSNVKEKALKDLLSAEDYFESYPYYIAKGIPGTPVYGNPILVGIKVNKDSIIDSDTDLKITIAPLNLPLAEPKIDIGVDNIIEWIYPGSPTNQYSEFTGYTTIENIQEEGITGNCERIYIPKTFEINLGAYLKGNTPPTVRVYQDIDNVVGRQVTCQNPTPEFSWVYCNVTSDQGFFQQGDYYFCLTGSSSNSIALSQSSEIKEGYHITSSSLDKIDNDYLIKLKFLEQDQLLRAPLEVSISNQKATPLNQEAALYLYNCVITEYQGKSVCIIPIKVTSEDDNQIVLSKLSFRELTSDERLIGGDDVDFATKLEEQGETLILYLDTPPIDLQKFSLNAPSALNTYKLRAEFKSYSDEKNILVIPKPIANLSASSILLAPGEQTVFSAEGSTSPDSSALTYNFTFSDNTSYTTQTVTKSFAKSGKYTVTLVVKDAKGRLSTPKTDEITVSTLISRAPKKFQEIKYSFDNAYKYYQAAPQEMKEVYTDLGLDTLIESSKTTLDDYEAKLNTSQQLPNIDEQLASISEKTPRILSVQDSLTIKPYLTYNDLSSVYPAEQEESKIAIQGVNEKIEKEFKAKIVKLTYINAAQESFVLIKKTFRTQVPLTIVFIKEVLPPSMVASQLTFIKETPEVIDSKTLNYRFDSFTDEISFVYKLNSDNLLLIPNIITILTPEKVNTRMVAFNCPNGECNPGEDYLSCPEDCICGNNKCEKDKGETFTNCPDDCSNFPWTSFIITIAVILLIGSLIAVSKLKPGYLTSIKPVRKLMSMLSINPKIPFSSLAQLNKLIVYIKDTRAKGISEREIRNALLKKGWSEKQINFAFMRTKS